MKDFFLFFFNGFWYIKEIYEQKYTWIFKSLDFKNSILLQMNP